MWKKICLLYMYIFYCIFSKSIFFEIFFKINCFQNFQFFVSKFSKKKFKIVTKMFFEKIVKILINTVMNMEYIPDLSFALKYFLS